MHGSTSPSKKRRPACSQRTCSRTSSTARWTRGSAGSGPSSRSTTRVGFVPVHSGKLARRRTQYPSGALEREQPGAPAFVGHPGTLGRDLVGRRVGQVAHDLPADGGIGVEQPVDHSHGVNGAARNMTPSGRYGARFRTRNGMNSRHLGAMSVKAHGAHPEGPEVNARLRRPLAPWQEPRAASRRRHRARPAGRTRHRGNRRGRLGR